MAAKSSLPDIDWEAFYRHSWHANDDNVEAKEQAAFWNSRAADFAAKAHNAAYRQLAEQLLDKFNWNWRERVLDVGAGPGTFAIPLAKRVDSVTAIDVSPQMLEQLRLQAARENVHNIETYETRWLSSDEKKYSGYDTVICFNALGVSALREDGTCDMGAAIERLKKAAKRGIILVPHADCPADAAMRSALGISGGKLQRERVAVLYHIMVHHGLLPNLEIIQKPFFWTFKNIDEAVQILSQRLGIEGDSNKTAKLAEHIKKRIDIEKGKDILLHYNVAQALFSWVSDE